MTDKIEIPDDVVRDALKALKYPEHLEPSPQAMRAAGRVFVEWEQERVRGLMEKSHRALSPFVFEAKAYDPPEDDDNQLLYGEHHLTIGHLRNARDAYDALLAELGRQSIRARNRKA